MFSSLIFKFFVLVQLASIADAHSWVHCVKYEPNNQHDREYNNDALCRGVPRQWYKEGGYASRHELGQEFGADRGFHIQVNTDRSGARCQGTIFPGRADGFDVNYGGEQNLVHYTQGETYTLNWPTKNHVAAECLNRFIPDTFLRLNIFKQNEDNFPNNLKDPSQDEFDAFTLDTSFGRDPHVNGVIDFKGFQNCPRFCENQDKSLCTGTFNLPDDLEPGLYTFQWNWELNANVDQYATCWEAYVDPKPTTTVAETTTTNAETTTTVPETTTTGVAGDKCYTAICGCPDGGYDQAWCDDTSALMTNPYCAESQSNCENDCKGNWCSLDGPIDTNAPCRVADLKQDPDTNNFNAQCQYGDGLVPVGGTCNINALPGYVGGSVECIGGQFKYTPATCIDCCERGNFLAPGTESFVAYPDINTADTMSFTCPDGYQGQYSLLCTRQGSVNRVILSDGACSVSCLASEAQRNYDMGYDDNEDSDALIATLITIVVVLMVILITYVLYKEEMLCFAAKDSAVAGSINNTGSKIDFEYTPDKKKRGSIERNL